MKVAFVVPRYGIEVLGGAELGARMIAEHIVVQPGWQVEVFTTCARDSTTWADELAAGTEHVNGVPVHRFASASGRDPGFERLSDRVMTQPWAASPADEEHWIELQGPVCPDALDAAEASDADVVVFYPYLYWPTVHGVRRLGARAVLQPATHDEAPARLPLFREVFTRPGGLIFHTPEEQELTERLFPRVAGRPQAVLGLGVDDGAGDEAAARAALGVGDRPYLLCIGRVDDGKGAALLARWFTAYKRRHPGPLALVFAGQVVDAPPPHDDVVLAGPVSEETKWGALRGAEALVSPSHNESFSLVLLEAWAAGAPVIVNGACPATTGHARRSGGGLWFTGYGSFEVALDRILQDRGLRDTMAAAGLAYVDRYYRWPLLTARYTDFLTSVAQRRRRPTTISTSDPAASIP
jgi:glycosyltransferase involved in cell wall biosynthesis